MTKKIGEEFFSSKDSSLNIKPVDLFNSLNQYIIGQDDVKKIISMSYVDRMRRTKIKDEELRTSIIPKNILMHGPTGVGKTEIARKLALITDSPFIKVEMTKFTEVGYAGKDIETIIKDLVEITIKKDLSSYRVFLTIEILAEVEKEIIKVYTQQKGGTFEENMKLYKDNKINDEIVEYEIIDELEEFLRTSKEVNDITSNFGSNLDLGGFVAQIGIIPMGSTLISTRRKRLRRNKQQLNEDGKEENEENSDKMQKVAVAKLISNLLSYRVYVALDENKIIKHSIDRIEQKGIVFLDEIDKLVGKSHSSSRGDVSREGVQRDLLPLIEGTIVTTKNGNVKTDHILFICAGAFTESKVTDLMSELQGRLPIKAELKALTESDLEKILTQVKNNLIIQQIELLKADNINIQFTPEAIKKIAHYTFLMNQEMENLGARRLHSVVNKIIEDVSFNATENNYTIDEALVVGKLQPLLDDKINLNKYTI